MTDSLRDSGDARIRYRETYCADLLAEHEGIVEVLEAWRNGDLSGEDAMLAIRDHIEVRVDA